MPPYRLSSIVWYGKLEHGNGGESVHSARFWRQGGILLLVLVLLFAAAPLRAGLAQAPPTPDDAPVIWFFWAEGCPYCALEAEFLAELQSRYADVTVRSLEVFGNPANRILMQRMAWERGELVQAVPVTIIGDDIWIGFNQAIGQAIERAVQRPGAGEGEQATAPSAAPGETERPGAGTAPADEGMAAAGEFLLELPLLGSVDLSQMGLFLSTLIISFVDGLNPCSLWVLSVLLALVIRSRSRRKTLWVGVTFLVVTALIYGGFIAGLFSVFSYVELSLWLRIAVAAVALAAAFVHIKDYFAFGKGISLTIPDRYKPGLYARMRAILHAESPWRSILLTVALAVGVSFIELPCTAGLPILWTNLLAAEGVGTAGFIALLAVYLVIYVLDELVVFLAALITLRVTKLEERHGRTLKLIGGVLMLYLGLTLLLKPDLMNSVAGAGLVFAAAAGTVLIVLAASGVKRRLTTR